MNEDVRNASETLIQFLSAMKDWENKFANLFKREHGGPEAHGDQAEAELQPIYEKYVAVSTQGRLALSAGYPPTFDPDAEKIISSELGAGNRVLIETLWTHPNVSSSTRRHRYTMVNRDGEWRLDRKELYDPRGSKWVRKAL